MTEFNNINSRPNTNQRPNAKGVNPDGDRRAPKHETIEAPNERGIDQMPKFKGLPDQAIFNHLNNSAKFSSAAIQQAAKVANGLTSFNKRYEIAFGIAKKELGLADAAAHQVAALTMTRLMPAVQA